MGLVCNQLTGSQADEQWVTPIKKGLPEVITDVLLLSTYLKLYPEETDFSANLLSRRLKE